MLGAVGAGDKGRQGWERGAADEEKQCRFPRWSRASARLPHSMQHTLAQEQAACRLLPGPAGYSSAEPIQQQNRLCTDLAALGSVSPVVRAGRG